jgi:hypothetical protein
MTQRSTSADDGGIVGHDRVRNVLQGILRAAQTSWTDASLEGACGVKARAIKSYRVEGKMPPLPDALSLCVVLGEPALNAILATIGYIATPLDEPDVLQPMQIVADGLAQFAVISAAAADNRIDHTEERSVTAAADMLIATVLPLSSAGRAA